ncbi:MAG: hypothetical protein IPN17_15245 [Deltaproteobacteria bacterium]|nr:hypothetical protein [Deltaproteobacteria bacterium]
MTTWRAVRGAKCPLGWCALGRPPRSARGPVFPATPAFTLAPTVTTVADEAAAVRCG